MITNYEFRMYQKQRNSTPEDRFSKAEEKILEVFRDNQYRNPEFASGLLEALRITEKYLRENNPLFDYMGDNSAEV